MYDIRNECYCLYLICFSPENRRDLTFYFVVEQVVLCGSNLDDNNWHSIEYKRRAHEIRLKVDNVTVTRKCC